MKKNLFFILILFFSLISTQCIQLKEGLLINGKLSSPLVVENFEGCNVGDSVAPKGTEVVTLKGLQHESDGWGISQGDSAANKWIVSIAGEGYKSGKSLKYDWDNKNEVWLDSSIWFWNPQIWKGAEEFRFWIQSKKQYKFDLAITIQTRKGKQVTFSATTPRVGGDNKWKEVKTLLKKFSIPDWYITEQGDPGIRSIPKTPVVVAMGISPVWHSSGECLIDQLSYGKASVKEIPIKMKKQKSWTNVDSFVCYYGSGAIAEMSQFDVAIVEGRSQNAENIKKLRDSGTWVVSYVTIGEEDKLSKGDGKGPGGYASYYMDSDMDGKPDKNENWASYYVNAGSPLWQDKIINGRVKNIIEKMGADGIFMDTVDTVEIYKDTEPGMVSLIANIRKKYPNIKIVQNRGFSVLKKTLPYIDGLMYEDFSIHYNWEDDSYDFADKSKLISTGIFATKINELRKKKNIQVFDLGYADLSQKDLIQFCYDRGWEYDFIPYVASIMLDEVYPKYTPHSKRGVKKYTGEGGSAEVQGDLTKLEDMKKFPDVKQKIDKGNFALYLNKATVKADSSFQDYDIIHVIDGYTNDSRLEWNVSAWASLELPVEHWVEIDLPTPKKVKKVVVYWALDSGKYYTSKEVKVQYFFQGYWKDLGVIKTDGQGNVHKSVLNIKNPEVGRQFRFFQPSGQGSQSRPDLMWIAEIELY